MVKVSQGTLTAVAEGVATVTATAINGVSDSVEVRVAKSGVVLDRAILSLKVGEAQQLEAKRTDGGAGTLRWRSGNEGVAMVTQEGEVIGMSVGEAEIVAELDDGAQASCLVTVTETPVKSVSLSKEKLRLKAGEQEQLTVEISPANATDKRLEWAGSDESVATVDGFGNVTAVAKGSAKIGVRAASGVYAICKVKVE